ncbi:YqhG family protein [Paenibacillus sp. NPDC058071]|uniref:YqhG family protein n=1 Tax=Paenibacillus sp. NPDC058071 TaxID=3346326 RepID=UPI0036DB3C12
MNEKQVHKFVHRYLEAADCAILEKSPAHITVKLSPAADRELTNRPYYWGFVDRTGAPPETMTYLFVTDKQKYDEAESPKPGSGAPSPQEAAADAALSRTYGILQGNLNTSQTRMPREDLHFGSRKLEQLFQAAKTIGSFVNMFQEPDKRNTTPFHSTPYTAWLGVNVKVEFASDRKREEIHSFGISLATGFCTEHFHDRLLSLKLTPRLPANVHITRNGISHAKALSIMEQTLEKKLRAYDYGWATDAAARLDEELERIHSYYEPQLKHAVDEAAKAAIEDQYRQRQQETRWQYEPRVRASAINCGIFHLAGIE